MTEHVFYPKTEEYPMKLKPMMIAGFSCLMALLAPGSHKVNAQDNQDSTAYAYQFKTIDGAPLKLADYKGRVFMVVNTASLCGFTKQYADLQNLYEAYKDKGFVIIGIPANDFGEQEPGSNAEIKKFCETNYKITFPMAEKEVVSGEQAHPFYKWARQHEDSGILGSGPKWNFHKYLIDKKGRLAASYASITNPGDKQVIEEIEKLLAD
jgi:glutathione peroxidase